MTISELKARIESRGFTVEAINSTGDKHELVVKGKDGNRVPWPVITTGKSGAINSVQLKSYHPPKVEGQNEHATVAIFGDLYLQHNGQPSAADKAIAAALTAPKQEVEPEPKKEVQPEPAPKHDGKKGRKQQTA